MIRHSWDQASIKNVLQISIGHFFIALSYNRVIKSRNLRTEVYVYVVAQPGGGGGQRGIGMAQSRIKIKGLVLESYVDLNQKVGSILSQEPIWHDFQECRSSNQSIWINTWDPLESWVDSESIPWKAAWVMNWIDSTLRDTDWVMQIIFSGRHSGRKPKKVIQSQIEWDLFWK